MLLLTILNEKIYRNGETDLKVAIRGIISASNELPPQNTNLAPIWDRFLIRLEMGNIKQFGNFLEMITNTKDVYEDDVPAELKLHQEELDQWAAQIDAIEVGPEVLNTIQLVKVKLIESNARNNRPHPPIIVHDRRWKKIIRLLRTSAFLNGRAKVDLMDCFLMLHCLWGHPEQRETIQDILTEAIAKHGYTMAVNLNLLKKEIKEFQADVEQETRIEHVVSEEQLMPIDDTYFHLEKRENGFQGEYITIKQYRQLTIDDTQIINFYDANKNLVNRLKASKGAKENTVDVFHDSMKHSYPLGVKLADRKEVIVKKPHTIIQKYWDERYQKLTAFVNQQIEHMTENAPVELSGIQHNLFVQPDFADVVKKNFEEVATQLKALKLDLEKLQFYYTSI